MKVVIVILAVFTFIACLFLGLYLGETCQPQAQNATPEVSPTLVLAHSSIEQHTITLIQADDLTAPTPHLVGIWGFSVLPRISKN